MSIIFFKKEKSSNVLSFISSLVTVGLHLMTSQTLITEQNLLLIMDKVQKRCGCIRMAKIVHCNNIYEKNFMTFAHTRIEGRIIENNLEKNLR